MSLEHFRAKGIEKLIVKVDNLEQNELEIGVATILR
jgi:hypothetical protein